MNGSGPEDVLFFVLPFAFPPESRGGVTRQCPSGRRNSASRPRGRKPAARRHRLTGRRGVGGGGGLHKRHKPRRDGHRPAEEAVQMDQREANEGEPGDRVQAR